MELLHELLLLRAHIGDLRSDELAAAVSVIEEQATALTGATLDAARAAAPDAGLRKAIDEALEEPGVRGHGRRVLELAIKRAELLASPAAPAGLDVERLDRLAKSDLPAYVEAAALTLRDWLARPTEEGPAE
jgi:hypothetical protein